MSRTRPFRRLRVPALPLAAAIAALLVGCRPSDATNEAAASDDDSPILNLPAIPDPGRAMDREALLAAVARAASAVFVGSDDMQQQRALDGSPFELRIRFGCGGPDRAGFDGGLGWTVDDEARTLRVRARPTISAQDSVAERIVAGLGNGIEAVEGFWIPRTWLLEPGCPAAGIAEPGSPTGAVDEVDQGADASAQVAEADDQAVPASGPRVGIAQFFTEAEPRTRRRQARAYETVKTLGPNERPSGAGFDLVLSGRLRSLAGGRVIACVPVGSDAPPDCVASADFDRVRIERADTGDLIAQWESG